MGIASRVSCSLAVAISCCGIASSQSVTARLEILRDNHVETGAPVIGARLIYTNVTNETVCLTTAQRSTRYEGDPPDEIAPVLPQPSTARPGASVMLDGSEVYAMHRPLEPRPVGRVPVSIGAGSEMDISDYGPLEFGRNYIVPIHWKVWNCDETVRIERGWEMAPDGNPGPVEERDDGSLRIPLSYPTALESHEEFIAIQIPDE